MLWDTLALVTLDETKEVLAEDFEDHADMCAIGTSVSKVVEEGDDVRSAGMGLGRGGSGVWVGRRGDYRGSCGCDETLEQLDLVEGSFCISGS